MKFTRPNILLLLTDQQRFDTIQALGSSFAARTPNMDALAREGVAFENAFCTAPICSPSRSTLLTGLYPTPAGVPGNLGPANPPLSPALPTVGKWMRAGGYQTVYHGKWHLGGRIEEHGFEVTEDCSHDETTRLMASRFWKDRDWMNHDRPFFHIVSFLNPHDHYFYDPKESVSGFKRPWGNTGCGARGNSAAAAGKQVEWMEERWGAYFRFYEKLIERVDGDIGETLHQFRCSGFYRNSWIIFASDHGDMAGEHDLPFKGPFMFDGVTRVPLVIVPPQGRFGGPELAGADQYDFQPGRRKQLCSLIDVVPTILDIGRVPIPSGLLGRSLLPVVGNAEAKAPHEYVFAEWQKPDVRMVRSTEWKYVAYENGDEELYDMANDPAERNNLARETEVAGRKTLMVAVLKNHLESIRDDFVLDPSLSRRIREPK